LGTKGLEPLRF